MKVCCEFGYRVTNKTVENGRFYPYGIGCDRWPDCFSCPFIDCVWSPVSRRKNRKNKGDVDDDRDLEGMQLKLFGGDG